MVVKKLIQTNDICGFFFGLYPCVEPEGGSNPPFQSPKSRCPPSPLKKTLAAEWEILVPGSNII
jgi:hypothetical protein